MSKIAGFEAIAERLVEGVFSRLFAERLRPQEVCLHLARAMEDYQALSSDGTPQAPTHYWVFLHPDDFQALAVERPALERELAQYVVELAAEAALALAKPPSIELLAEATVDPHEVRVDARWIPPETPEMERTHEMAITAAHDRAIVSVPPPGRPFLILEGRRHVDLLQPTVSIGRALDNDIIIEDTRVSRHHAQLRRRFDRFVLYDLGSRGGTEINGYPVEECVLHAGDVVSLAGIEIIYGEDLPPTIPMPDQGDTPVLEPADNEQE
jgi:hypothetical protein